MRTRSLVVLAAFAISLAGCGDGPAEPTLEQDPDASVSRQTLDANRQRFEGTVGSSYTYEYQNVCFCAPDSRLHVRVSVRDGARVNVVRVDDGSAVPAERWDEFLTVTEIFDDIRTALDEGAASVRVEFDEALGYPREVFIDIDQRIADEERGYEVRNLEAQP